MVRKFWIFAWVHVLAMAASSAFTQTPPSFTPLDDLADGLYLNEFQGGLYPNGSNAVPESHAAEGVARAAAIQPRNTLGQPDANGKYALASIGMSNTTQEFCGATSPSGCGSWTFMGQAAANPGVDHTSLALVNGAAGGKSAAFWDSPTDPDYDRVVTQWLTPNGLSEQQVEAAWVKVANPGPMISLPNANADAYLLVQQMGNISRALKVRYPNLEQVFFSSRIYAGYATTTLNPEPYAYESGLAVKWLIEAQINQMNGGGIDPRAGNLDYTSGVAPWLAWGPYLWADGLNPRSDGLVWQRSDLQSDGTHPSQSGEQKVGAMLMDFMANSPFTAPWFFHPTPGDYNRNGHVDAADYTLWRNTLGQSVAVGSGADGTGPNDVPDGLVDRLDYNFWKLHYGQPPGSGMSADIGGANVPEPDSHLLFMCSVVQLVAGGLGIRYRPRCRSVRRDRMPRMPGGSC